MKRVIRVAEEFSKTPGARKKSEGPFSGEEFRELFLVPALVHTHHKLTIEIQLDGSAGYAGSFIEEAFGGLARMYGANHVLQRMAFISQEDPELVVEIIGCIEDTIVSK